LNGRISDENLLEGRPQRQPTNEEGKIQDLQSESHTSMKVQRINQKKKICSSGKIDLHAK